MKNFFCHNFSGRTVIYHEYKLINRSLAMCAIFKINFLLYKGIWFYVLVKWQSMPCTTNTNKDGINCLNGYY